MKTLATITSAIALTFSAYGTALAQAPAPVQIKPSPTVEAIKARGTMACAGHNGSNLGFTEVDDKGNWKGLDVDICKAVATAILGSPDKTKFAAISFAQRWPALNSGEIDVLVKTTDATMSRDTELGYVFSVPYLFGAFQFLAHKGPKTAAELNGGTLCTSGGSNNVRYLSDFLKVKNLKAEVLTFDKREEERAAYASKRCDANMLWGPTAAITRADQKNPDDHVVLPDVIAVAPQVVIMREGDERLVKVVNWVFQVLWIAEEQGITKANVDSMKASPPNPVVEKLLGVTPGIGRRLGLDDNWAFNVIKAMGNYAEIYDRNFGGGSPYKLARGMNALWKDGGVLVPMLID
jgi:general L-amino acid transport system substrate-binding protein